MKEESDRIQKKNQKKRRPSEITKANQRIKGIVHLIRVINIYFMFVVKI